VTSRDMVPYGIYIVHACMIEIKEYDVRAHGHGMLAFVMNQCSKD